MNENTSVAAKNIYFVNVAKTMTIALVIFAHLALPDNITAFINSFRMPLFFFVSGYLIKTDNVTFGDFVLKKVRTLLLPYFVFVVFSFLFWFFAGRNFGDDAASNPDIVKYIAGIFLSIPEKTYLGFNFPLWFLPCLFFTCILLYPVRNKTATTALVWAAALFCAGLLVKTFVPFRLPWGIDVSFFALLFVWLGKTMRNNKLFDRYVVQPDLWIKLLLAAVFLCLTIFLSQTNLASGLVKMNQREFNNLPLFFAAAVCGILFVLYLSVSVPRLRLFDFYGRNTIVILGLHIVCFSVIKGIQVFILKIPVAETSDCLSVYILYVVAAFLLLAPVIEGINRFIPEILGRKRR